MTVLDLARAEIRNLAAYSSARMEASGGNVLLNANENPWPPHGDDGQHLNRYPDPQPAELVEKLAAIYGVTAAQTLVGRGSDEFIDLLTRAFCRARKDGIVISPPTFGMYAVCARIQNARVREVPLRADRDFSLDIDALLKAVTTTTRLVYVCTPNNPTGGVVGLKEIEYVATALKDRAVLVIDEAYGEFSSEASAASLLAQHDNLVVLRTLSKAFALAGARIGVALAAPELIDLLRRVMAPYPLPAVSVNAALKVLSSEAISEMHQRVGLLCAERDRLLVAFAALPVVKKIWPSAANFLCLRFADAQLTYRTLLAQGIVLRNVSHYPGLTDCLRISIGRSLENQRVLAALGALTEVV